MANGHEYVPKLLEEVKCVVLTDCLGGIKVNQLPLFLFRPCGEILDNWQNVINK